MLQTVGERAVAATPLEEHAIDAGLFWFPFFFLGGMPKERRCENLSQFKSYTIKIGSTLFVGNEPNCDQVSVISADFGFAGCFFGAGKFATWHSIDNPIDTPMGRRAANVRTRRGGQVEDEDVEQEQGKSLGPKCSRTLPTILEFSL